MSENEEINKLITEKLFGEHYHILKRVMMGVFSTIQCAECGDTDPKNRFFDMSDADIREAREKLAEKGLQTEFYDELMDSIPHKNKLRSVHFECVNASPEMQARAICRVLENL